MIDFIFGDAGSGKSEYIYTWISREAQNAPYKQFYLFVPEQNTLKAQQEIIAKSPCHGMLNLEVLSFQLLAYRVMEELGLEKPVLIDEVSKSILLRKAVSACADRLKIYKSKVNSPGFITQMKTLISELCQYDADPEELRKAGESSRLPLLSGKLSDISEIWTQFRKLC